MKWIVEDDENLWDFLLDCQVIDSRTESKMHRIQEAKATLESMKIKEAKVELEKVLLLVNDNMLGCSFVSIFGRLKWQECSNRWLLVQWCFLVSSECSCSDCQRSCRWSSQTCKVNQIEIKARSEVLLKRSQRSFESAQGCPLRQTDCHDDWFCKRAVSLWQQRWLLLLTPNCKICTWTATEASADDTTSWKVTVTLWMIGI